MSEYVKYDCSTFTSEETLLAALAEMGWKSEHIERHEKPVTLYGYHGDARPEKANLVIRRNNVGGSANDIGFLKQEDGTYQPIVSEFDTHSTGFRQRGTDTFVNILTKNYTRINGEKSIQTVLNTTIPRMKQQGIVPRTAMPTVVRVGSKVEVKLVY